MKATFLTTVFAALVLTTSVNAENVKTYNNVESNELGTTKEYITVDSETLAPLTKETYVYDLNGNMTEKKVSKWGNNKTGWINSSKYEYTYTISGKVANITFTEWNGKKNNWADTSEFLVHVYNDNNELLSIDQIQINNSDKFITQK
ncbi:MAG: DUF3836 domain-containing protein [Prevotella sp.]|jgi:hypothetical protein|nr:DUF3836 domain-containing protein [Prevotella sp.]